MKKYELDGTNISLTDVYEIATSKEVHLMIGAAAWENMKRSRQVVLDIVQRGKPVYGINTGFGALASKQIADTDLTRLQYNLIRSHCTGVGRPFDRTVTRAIMVCRANCLIQGYSGVTPDVVKLLLNMVNLDITPVVPEKGSVGASGDLAPLSHIALALIGEGDVVWHDKVVRADFALSQVGLKPAVLGPKDGLALINGTAVMLALGAVALHEAESLMKQADIISCLTLDAVRGTATAFDERISRLKPQPGQVAVSANLNKILAGSEVINSHPEDGKVQDPYSLRCIPQVLGAACDTIDAMRPAVLSELAAVTDNPLVFPDPMGPGDIISGGNFHGMPVAIPMDVLSIALAHVAGISERRTFLMLAAADPEAHLRPYLSPHPGVSSGLMIAQYTAAACCNEIITLCTPASVANITTSAGMEDYNSFGPRAASKLARVIDLTRHVVAIELLCAAQALEYHRPLKSGRGVEQVYQSIRGIVPPLTVDRSPAPDIEAISELIADAEFSL